MGAMATRQRSLDSFTTASTLTVGDRNFAIHRLGALDGRFDIGRLPYSLKIVLENLLRHEDGRHVHAADIEAVAGWGGRPGGRPPSSPPVPLPPAAGERPG